MKKILLFGAGKSATDLIDYLGKYADKNKHSLFVCDQSLDLAQSKIHHLSHASAVSIDVTDASERGALISGADIVISMMPPALHFLIAKDCVAYSKNLLTASYLSEEIKSLEKEINAKGLLFLGEMGLDPGIDHMSAMHLIKSLKEQGAEIKSFYSHCGGLVAPESDDNPWHYKITWNPANVVLAGNAGASYLRDGKIIEVPYEEIFARENQLIETEEGPLAWYANRDSLSYIDLYDLQGIQTFIRTTLRYPAYNRAWNLVIHLGLTATDDRESIAGCETYADWFSLKLSKVRNESILTTLQDSEIRQQFEFLGFHSNQPLPVKESSAKVLQTLLEKNLAIKPHDKDMIVMVHEVEYVIKNKFQKTTSTLIVKGENNLHTAMSKTVGYPLAIATTLVLENKIPLTGLHIPVLPEIYIPLLDELKNNGIAFHEVTV
ncbi:MAG: saccharopine dehydrogenase NADP-binding domain-containing protein [Chitinophagaceae bacterium]|nr:saccharopine dehydrogenase NADP-binding domain-containing protein [Chitinophagaceae bacterium]MCZ2397256.1 saccharopine dehydrogenase NADP-binding domain-containing protein [Chitinophagales bacterium]